MEVKYLKIIAKKTLVALCLFVFLAGGGLAYALNTLTWHQNPLVPTQNSFTTSPTIAAGTDQTAMWTYDATNQKFTASVTITNTGNAAWTPTITATTITNWAFSTSTLTAINPGASSTATLTMTYSGSGTPNAGVIGDFQVTIS